MNDGLPTLRWLIGFAVVFIVVGLVFFGSCKTKDSGPDGSECIGSQVFC